MSILVSSDYFATAEKLQHGFHYKLTRCCIFAETFEPKHQIPTRIVMTELSSEKLLWVPLKIEGKPAEASSYYEIVPLHDMGNYYVGTDSH